MTVKEIYSCLEKLPPDTDAKFSEELKKTALEIEEEDIDELCSTILDKNDENENLKFSLYYSITTSLRRKQSNTKFCQMVEKYGSSFPSHPLSYITLSTYYKYIAETKHQNNYYEFAIENAEKAINLVPQNLGVYNNYAEIVVDAFDNGYDLKSDEINNSLKYMDKIMAIKKYPKWHYTKSKLLFIQGKFEEAKENIKVAIDLEDANGKDSLLRISQYNNFLLNIRTSETLVTINEKLKNAKNEIEKINEDQEQKSKKMLDELDAVKSKYLEFLAFFASIIAFITSSISIVTTFKNVYEAGALVMIFSGCQALAFCIFRLLITYNNEKKLLPRNILSFIFALLLLSLGFCVAYFFGGR